MSVADQLLEAVRRPVGVVLAWLHPGTVRGEFMDSVMGLLLHDAVNGRHVIGPTGGFMALRSGPRVAEARSQIVDAFLGHDAYAAADWLLMLDSDMTFGGDLVERLLAVAHRDERPIVGGLCFAGAVGRGIWPTLYVATNTEGEMDRIVDYPRDALVKVDATGAACLLVHRSVFTKMRQVYGRKADGSNNPYPWFQEGVTNSTGGCYGEDIVFCLRAGTVGCPTHVHTGIRIGHVKDVELTEALFDEHRARTEVSV